MTTSSIVAQSDTTNALDALVEKLLPSSPADLLLLGEFADLWVANLEAQGYRVTGLRWRDPECQQLPPAGARGELLQVKLVAPQTVNRRFDAVLALDFAPDIHPLALFDQLEALLAQDGVVILAGCRAENFPGPWLDYVEAVGGRCGFDVEAQSSDAGESLFVRAFRRSTVALRWRVNHVLPENYPEVAALFWEVFGHSMSRDLWEWKYGAGRGNAVMARSDGKIVAHYGGMYRDILLCGKPDRVAQICDVMVQSSERGVLTKKGPFFLLGASWPEIYGPKGFGFPNKRAMQVAEKMGLYAKAGQMVEVRWSPGTTRYRLSTRVRSLNLDDSVADHVLVNQAWEQMAKDLRGSVVGVRNWDYLERRYFRHPLHHYEVLLVSSRFTGRPLGIAVLRRLEAACELLDVIAPLRNLASVIDQARRMTGRWGLPYLYCWITSNHLSPFLVCEGSEHALDISIPASSWTADPQSEQFIDKWWLMSGDTDFR